VSRVVRLTVRASSAVECMNSVLRMHQSRHKTVTQGLLDLKRLYWNCRAFREGKRRGRCPYEHLGLKLPSYRFWDLLWMPIPAAALSHAASPCADSFSRKSSGVNLRNSQKLKSGNFRPSRP
jgi:hypothetical protein